MAPHVAPPISISPAILAQIIKTPPEILEQIFIDLYPPNFFTDDNWFKEFERKCDEQETADMIEKQASRDDERTKAHSEGLPFPEKESKLRERKISATSAKTRAWGSVKIANEALIYFLDAKPELKPQIDRILILHVQREGRVAAKEIEEQLRSSGKGGWKGLMREYNAQLGHVNGTGTYGKGTSDYI